MIKRACFYEISSCTSGRNSSTMPLDNRKNEGSLQIVQSGVFICPALHFHTVSASPELYFCWEGSLFHALETHNYENVYTYTKQGSSPSKFYRASFYSSELCKQIYSIFHQRVLQISLNRVCILSLWMNPILLPQSLLRWYASYTSNHTYPFSLNAISTRILFPILLLGYRYEGSWKEQQAVIGDLCCYYSFYFLRN